MIKEICISILDAELDSSNIDNSIDQFTDFLLSEGVSSISNKPPHAEKNTVSNGQQAKILNFTLHIPCTLDENAFMLKVLSNYNVKFLASFKEVSNVDWVLLSQSTFKPIYISNRIWVGASWHEIPVETQHDRLLKIFIDPGLAFGTGSHPTTKLCLESLVLLSQKNKNAHVLDLGCGSGILSIAACKLGFPVVTAIDNDSDALNIAKENVFKNKINKENCYFYNKLEDTDVKFDLIISNIFFTTLSELSSLILNKLNNNGSLILSGILVSQVYELQKIYRSISNNTISLNKISSEKGWACLSHFGFQQPGEQNKY